MTQKRTIEDQVELYFAVPETKFLNGIANEYQGYLIQGAKSKAKAASLKKVRDASSRLIAAAKRAVTRKNAKTIICEKLEFCEQIESKHVQTAIAIADTILKGKLVLLGLPPLPPTKIAVFLIRASILDDLCGCPKKKKA